MCLNINTMDLRSKILKVGTHLSNEAIQRFENKKDNLTNISILEGDRWAEIITKDNQIDVSGQIWVFDRDSVTSKNGTLSIYAKDKKRIDMPWKYKASSKVLDIGENGYNMFLIKDFKDTLLMLSDITMTESRVFIKQELWITSKFDIKKMIEGKGGFPIPPIIPPTNEDPVIPPKDTHDKPSENKRILGFKVLDIIAAFFLVIGVVGGISNGAPDLLFFGGVGVILLFISSRKKG